MDGLMDSDEMRKMTIEELVDQLSEEDEDVDDLIEAELQRRTLGQLRVMSVALLVLLGLALVGLVLAVLVLAGVLGVGTNRDRGEHIWSSWTPAWAQSLRR